MNLSRCPPLMCAIAVATNLVAWRACAESNPSALVFVHARVFDGISLLPGETTVVVENGLITGVGSSFRATAGAKEIDATGKTLLPGLIDSHTHVIVLDALRTAPIFGVTTELDMFSSLAFLDEARKILLGPEGAQLADLRSSGTLVTAPHGHGTEYGLDIPTITNSADAQAFVDARIAEGSDYIKIVYDDGAAFQLSMPTLSKETMRAVITATHNRKKLAVVHIGSLQGARDAIAAGADGLAHLFIDRPPDPEFSNFAAAHQAFVVPTLLVLQGVAGIKGGDSLASDPDFSPYLTSADKSNLAKSFSFSGGSATNFSHAEAAVRQLKAAAVPILAGTDSPNPGTAHGASLHQELELLVHAGFTPNEALAAATSVPASQFKLNDRGRITLGKRADLLLVDGDPTADILVTRKIAGVWKAGVEIDRAAWRAEVAKENAKPFRRTAAVPAAVKNGLVSDFEDGKPSARFGRPWEASTDVIRGGKSKATIKVVEGGAHDSKGSLLIEGEVAAGLPYAWSGAIFYPGHAVMTPADLSSKKKITFWAKGDQRTYNVMLFAQSRGFMPATQNFNATSDW